jgi:hypothetical protein
MMGLVKKEELYPESKAHLTEEGMDAHSAGFSLGQPSDEIHNLAPETVEANQDFLDRSRRPLRPGGVFLCAVLA